MKIFWTKKAYEDHLTAETMRRLAIEAVDSRFLAHHLIQKRAAELAVRMLIKHLDDRGVRHCWCCPSIEQLKKERRGFACPAHAEKLTMIEVVS